MLQSILSSLPWWQYHELHTSIIIPWMFLTITKRKLKSWRLRKTPLLLSSFCHSLLVIWSALLLLTVVNFYRKESSSPIFAHNLAGSVLERMGQLRRKNLNWTCYTDPIAKWTGFCWEWLLCKHLQSLRNSSCQGNLKRHPRDNHKC